MPISYPNRQTVIIALICITIIVGTLTYTNPKFLSQKNSWKNSNSIPIKNNNYYKTEASDLDWQNDFISLASTSDFVFNKDVEQKKDTPLTLTDKLGRDFFSRYVELKQNNLSGNQKSVESAMNQTLESAIKSAPTPNSYNISNLIVQNNSDSIALKQYGNNIGTIFMKNGPKTDPVTIASNALENENMALLEKIDPIISSYEKLTKAILVTPVPRPLLKSHLNLTNGLNSMLFVSQKLRNLEIDPLESMVALNVYTMARDSIESSLLEINNYFSLNNIYFVNSEPGILFATVPQ